MKAQATLALLTILIASAYCADSKTTLLGGERNFLKNMPAVGFAAKKIKDIATRAVIGKAPKLRTFSAESQLDSDTEAYRSIYKDAGVPLDNIPFNDFEFMISFPTLVMRDKEKLVAAARMAIEHEKYELAAKLFESVEEKVDIIQLLTRSLDEHKFEAFKNIVRNVKIVSRETIVEFSRPYLHEAVRAQDTQLFKAVIEALKSAFGQKAYNQLAEWTTETSNESGDPVEVHRTFFRWVFDEGRKHPTSNIEMLKAIIDEFVVWYGEDFIPTGRRSVELFSTSHPFVRFFRDKALNKKVSDKSNAAFNDDEFFEEEFSFEE